NIYVERGHSEMWRTWARGFGCSNHELDHPSPGPATDAINNYLWHVNTHGTLAEGLGATNLAIEWPTGEWAREVVPAARIYKEKGLAEINPQPMAWLEAHAGYDDVHPYEAMELIKLCTHTDDERLRVLAATRRGFEYYVMALDDCVG